MNSPYLIFDRQGNGVDINYMHDKTKSCHGCPDRVADPNCHGTCKGYIERVEQKEIENRERRLLNATYITDVDFEKRNRTYQSEKDDKKRKR
jgi:hypothetical protein